MAENKAVLVMARLIYEALIFHNGIFFARYLTEWAKVLGIYLLRRDAEIINAAVAVLESKKIMTHERIRAGEEETNKCSLIIPLPPQDDWGMGMLPWEGKYRPINRKLFAELQAIEALDLLDEPDHKKPQRKKKPPPDAQTKTDGT